MQYYAYLIPCVEMNFEKKCARVWMCLNVCLCEIIIIIKMIPSYLVKYNFYIIYVEKMNCIYFNVIILKHPNFHWLSTYDCWKCDKYAKMWQCTRITDFLERHFCICVICIIYYTFIHSIDIKSFFIYFSGLSFMKSR